MHRNLHICRIRPKRQIQQKPLRLLLFVEQQQILVEQQQILRIKNIILVEQQENQHQPKPPKFIQLAKKNIKFLQQQQLLNIKGIAKQQHLFVKPQHRDTFETTEHKLAVQQLVFRQQSQQQPC